MKKNLASWDKTLRIVFGLVALSQVFVGLHTPWGLIGLVLLVSGMINFCPLYRIVGLSTFKEKS